jgi:signal transduction histidine kinase
MVVTTVVRLLDWKARRNAVTVQTRFAENSPQAHGDRIQLEQVVFNLLQNAIEAVTSQPDGQRTVEIETTIASRMLTVRVRDTGLGVIDTERIFERFYTTKPEGMGLGLAISRSIAESHGGRLRATATKPGAEFVLELPADDEEHAI